MPANHAYTVTASRVIAAPSRRIYDIIANYHEGHPSILPRAFSNMVVEQGGVGAGTVVRFDVRALGRTQTFRARVTEPEPGRVLVEENIEPAPSRTTFTISSRADGSSDVGIRTEMPGRPGLFGRLERALSTAFLRRLYAEELTLLERRASRVS